MSDPIRAITSERDRAEQQDRYGVWIRRFGLLILLAVVVVALANVVGQRASSSSTTTGDASLALRAPSAVRPGLLFQAKISVTARHALPAAQIVLSKGWIDGLTLNSEEPGAASETSGSDGSLVLHIGALRAGQTYVQYLDYQVNPTSFSRRTQEVSLVSDGATVASLSRTLTIVP